MTASFPPDDKVSPLADVVRRIKRNPVIIAFFLAALVDVAVAEDVTWRATALAVLGVITRFFTAPQSEVEETVLSSFEEGVEIGAVIERAYPDTQIVVSRAFDREGQFVNITSPVNPDQEV